MGRLGHVLVAAVAVSAVWQAPAHADASLSLAEASLSLAEASLRPGVGSSFSGSVDATTADRTDCVVLWDHAALPQDTPSSCTWQRTGVTGSVTVPADATPGPHEVTAAWFPPVIRLQASVLAGWEVTAPVVVQTRVPETVTMTAADAAAALKLAGLVGHLPEDAAAQPDVWAVVAQDPVGGSWADPGSEVVLAVEPLARPPTGPPTTRGPTVVVATDRTRQPPVTSAPPRRTTHPPTTTPTTAVGAASSTPETLPTRPVSFLPYGAVTVVVLGLLVFLAGWLWLARRSRTRLAPAPETPAPPVTTPTASPGIPVPRTPTRAWAEPAVAPRFRFEPIADPPRVRTRPTSTEPAVAVRLDLHRDPGQQTMTEKATT